MSRIESLFQKKKAFIGYLTAGDGGIKRTKEAALALTKGGVDLLEIGIPFSDPIADGPVIENAMERALKADTTPNDVLDLVRDLRKTTDVPIVLFTYYNLIYIAGDTFLKKAKEAGVDGMLIVDLPIEEAEDYGMWAEEAGLDTIFLISPSTSEERIEAIAEASSGFLYYVCRSGTTGVQDAMPDDLAEKIACIKKYSSLPVAVGFGISNAKMAKEALKVADGFVVGSLLVKAIGEGKSADELKALTKSLDPR